MPTYEYECTKCGRLFELVQSMTDKPKRTLDCDCKQCNNKAPVMRRISGGAGVIFKGSGCYVTDYRSESYKKEAKAESDAASGQPAGESDSKKKTEKIDKEKKPKTESAAP